MSAMTAGRRIVIIYLKRTKNPSKLWPRSTSTIVKNLKYFEIHILPWKWQSFYMDFQILRQDESDRVGVQELRTEVEAPLPSENPGKERQPA